MDTLMSSGDSWPALGRPLPPPLESPTPHEPHPEWELVADTAPGGHAVPSGRPRSATISGEALMGEAPGGVPAGDSGVIVDTLPKHGPGRRTLRRCASTPDLVVGDAAHEVIVESESDSYSELVEPVDESDSFEVLSDNTEGEGASNGKVEEEPVLVEEEGEEEEEKEEEGTLVSAPSLSTVSWTMASAVVPGSGGGWGTTTGPSFKDILAKNLDGGDADWGKDKARTEARLQDSHSRHHLRVRTKPKFVVDDTCGGKHGRGLTHAHSTGDLSRILHAVEGGHESGGGRAHHHGRRMRKTKQLSAMLEEEEDEDYVIGRGAGPGSGDGADIAGETDAADYYHRKEHGTRTVANKKKERPDEAKRREITLHKKEVQRRNQQQSGGRGGGGGGGKKKTKHDKGFGGKKERRKF